MRSAPQSVCDNTFSKFNAFRHLAFKYLICGMKESLRSKRTPRNLKSSTTGIRDPYKYSSGSLCTFRNCVFDLENLKPLCVYSVNALL